MRKTPAKPADQPKEAGQTKPGEPVGGSNSDGICRAPAMLNGQQSACAVSCKGADHPGESTYSAQLASDAANRFDYSRGVHALNSHARRVLCTAAELFGLSYLWG